MVRIDSFDLEPGEILAGKYFIIDRIGDGWEGEVYRVKEKGTGVVRAAKLFYPQRNKHGAALRFTARKLHKLRGCPVVVQYHSQEVIDVDGVKVQMLLSELVEGVLLRNYVKQNRRLPLFEALQLLRELARGVACIHDKKDYHGDIHDLNVIIERRGVWFEVKLIDVYNHGKPVPERMADDVYDLISLFYDMLGGSKTYSKQPVAIKKICLGKRRTAIKKKFRNAQTLLAYLDSFSWD